MSLGIYSQDYGSDLFSGGLRLRFIPVITVAIYFQADCGTDLFQGGFARYQPRLKNIEERKQAAINPVASANKAATKA